MFLKRLFIIWSISLPAIASSKNYQIELIVFSHMTPAALKLEQWPILPDLTPPSATVTAPIFTPVPPTQFSLQWEERQLRKHPDYQILYHHAWQVSGKALKSSQTIAITSDDGNDILNGILELSLNRYFNTHLQLTFNEPSSNLQVLSNNPVFSTAPGTFHFMLDQKRRMRSKELNYIGHPIFGALLKITPVTTTSTVSTTS